jgi:hypothetical protein
LTAFVEKAVARPPVWRVLLNTFLYPALCLVFGFAIPGVALIPLTVLTRGFLLAYTVSSCVRVFGSLSGTVLAAAMTALPLILTLPCLLLLAVQGLTLSRQLMARKKTVFWNQRNLRKLGLVGVALAAAAVLEAFLCPVLAGAAVNLIL